MQPDVAVWRVETGRSVEEAGPLSAGWLCGWEMEEVAECQLSAPPNSSVEFQGSPNSKFTPGLPSCYDSLFVKIRGKKLFHLNIC